MSKEAKHTPGPWSIQYDGDIIDANGSCVATAFHKGIIGEHWVIQPPITQTYEEGRANARLISVSPELFDLCNAILGFEIATPKDYATKGAEAFSPLQRHIIDIQNKARVVKAKVEGL